MNETTILHPRLYFSYSQFMVYDESVNLPGCAWTEGHSAQGFARRDSAVNFNTLLEFGYAVVGICRCEYQRRPEHERVIAVPFLVKSGRIVVEGPEETQPGRTFALPPGNYRLVVAQRVRGQEEAIDLYFEPRAERIEGSAILVADAALHPPTPLIESAQIAGEE